MDTVKNTAGSTPLSKVEEVKSTSNHLRGNVSSELTNDAAHVTSDTDQILKHHGMYQQDNRDLRRLGTKQYSFLVRTRFPGGKLTAKQLLAEIDLCDEFGGSMLRVTDRQGLQLHGVLKHDLRTVVQRINQAKTTTMGACGDVVRNVMCCPAPVKDSPARAIMQKHTDALSEHFSLRSRAYYEIWLRDGEHSEQVGGHFEENTAIYGPTYLPRKFKFAFALLEDNCVDALTHDVGFVTLPSQRSRPHFNVYIGGGMGVTPARADTFAAVAQPFATVSDDELLPLSQAIVAVQREHGNRHDRKRARFKYLVADWGIDRIRGEVERHYGKTTIPAEPISILGMQDHLGWHEQDDGAWFLGLHIENGRIQDTQPMQLKSALRLLCSRYALQVRLTPLQDMLLCGIQAGQRDEVETLLSDHGVPFGDQTQTLRKLAMACPALPTCGLAITEAERRMPVILNALQPTLRELNLQDQHISIRMTGCPNGCARPYVAEIAIVGKAADKYTLLLGGSQAGSRLAFKYLEMQTADEIVEVLKRLLGLYAQHRNASEPFGDFCQRLGPDGLASP